MDMRVCCVYTYTRPLFRSCSDGRIGRLHRPTPATSHLNLKLDASGSGDEKSKGTPL